MVKSALERLPLNDGYTIPVIGFGTSGIKNEDAEELVFKALMRGYRLIDTASAYGNEEGVGRGIQRAINAGLSREDIFVVTKVWKTEMGYQGTMDAFDRSLDRLGLDYVDLYLIHWPDSAEGKNLDTWKAMQELKDSRRVNSIGVSNFGRGELNEILEACRIRPAVNQISISPGHMNADLDEYGSHKNIVTIAYSPLGGGKVIRERKLAAIGNKYDKTAAQISLKWCIDRGVVPIPKTSHDERMKDNLDLFDFELTDADIDTINNMERKVKVKNVPDRNQNKRHGARR